MSQNSTVLPTSGTLSGLQAVTDLNAALDTLNTKWSGASAPATAELGQDWLDTSTTPNTLRIYDGSQWVARAWIDAANHLFQPLPAGGVVSVGTVTLDHTHVGKLITNNASGVTATLPLAASVPAGTRLRFIQQQGSAGATFILAAGAGDTLRSVDNWYATTLTLGELGDYVEFESDGASVWFQVGKSARSVVNSTPVGASAYASTTSLSATSGTFTASSNGMLIIVADGQANVGLSSGSLTASLGALTGLTGFNGASTGSGAIQLMGWLTMTAEQSTTATVSIGTGSSTFMILSLRMFFLPTE